MWKRNWGNAEKFFKSKGNIQTKSKLKTKWYDEFVEDLKELKTKTKNKK